LDTNALFANFDPRTGALDGAAYLERRLSDLRGCFADVQAYDDAFAQGDPLLYRVASLEPAAGDGQLHYAIGTLMPGRVGAEYYLTKCHLHAWRPAAEVYLGLQGEGMMLLEDEATGATRAVPLVAHSAVYVPGHTAHRTINTGAVPLTYIGVYPAAAGHDYGAIAARNFGCVVVSVAGRPTVMDRQVFLESLLTGRNP
jgi:glucose-6-phosphate isomerase, archaeal